jgi:3',5'-cyclic AMP phosphodiesterase CpdA
MKTRYLRLAGAAVFVILITGAYTLLADKDPKVTEERLHAPSAIPDRVILTWAEDPATTQAVTWRTSTSVQEAFAEYAKATDGPQFVKKAERIIARTEAVKTNLNVAHSHSVNFTGLQPDTMYAYRVGDGFNWSEWNQFRTASDKSEPFSFLYVGDAQNDIFSLWSRVIRSAYGDAPKARFIIHAGDLVNRGSEDAHWGEWHQSAGWINRSIVSIPAPGNHEYDRRTPERAITLLWRPQFTLPENGLKELKETCYTLDIQGVRVVVLNSNEKHAEQAVWLDKVLAEKPQTWTVVTFHHPVFSTARGRDNKDLRQAWLPIFDKHRVDLVLTGHDHTYARSNLMTGMNSRAEGGTVYVVSVSGPKMYPVERQDWMERTAQDTQLYQVVRVENGRLSYEARTARGELYDAFELTKRAGQPNLLRNRNF